LDKALLVLDATPKLHLPSTRLEKTVVSNVPRWVESFISTLHSACGAGAGAPRRQNGFAMPRRASACDLIHSMRDRYSSLSIYAPTACVHWPALAPRCLGDTWQLERILGSAFLLHHHVSRVSTFRYADLCSAYASDEVNESVNLHARPARWNASRL